MRFSDADIEHRLRLGEDSAWEFKQVEFAGNRPSRPSRDDWADEIAAFANARGGVLLCGVSDDGQAQDMSREQMAALDALLVEVSTDSIKPPVRVQTWHRMLPEGRRVLLLEVPESDSQHDSPGGSYLRVGASKRRMTNDERLRLAQRRGQARFRWFDEQTVPNTGFRTLDESLWRHLLSAEGAANPEAALEKLALLAPDEAGVMRATVTGVLLCTRNPEERLPNVGITATHYRGRDRASGQIDAREIGGPLDQQVADAMVFVARNMRVAARKEPARVDVPEYSDRALFEALVNAVAHRDYSMRGSRIRLSMFEDRLEIQSPGSLPNNLTVDSMATRQAARNQTLTSVLGRMPVGGIRGSEERRYFMERRGDGVPIILRETRGLCGRPPEYRVIDDAEVCLVIPAAPQEPSPVRAVVSVQCAGKPLADVDVLALFPNDTWKRAATDEHGEARLELHSGRLPMTVFAAATGFSAHVRLDWLPAEEGRLRLELDALPGGGAVILTEDTGALPGLKGTLNPVRDALDRTWLYASNIAVNQGQPQPVHFIPGEDLRLTDADGNEAWARIVAVTGRSSLVEYRPAAKQGQVK